MNSAFKSGKNIWQAINIVKTSTESPIKEEFEIISKDIDYGLDLLTVFERFYKGQNSSENSVGIGLALAKNIIEKKYLPINTNNYSIYIINS